MHGKDLKFRNGFKYQSKKENGNHKSAKLNTNGKQKLFSSPLMILIPSDNCFVFAVERVARKTLKLTLTKV